MAPRRLTILFALTAALQKHALGQPESCVVDGAAEDAKYRVRQVKMGVLGVDYQYETNYGDILDERTHEFTLAYAPVPGLTFDLAKKGQFSDDDIRQERVPKECNLHGKDSIFFSKAEDAARPGDLPLQVEKNLEAAVRALLDDGVDFITGDCGFMFYYQIQIRNYVKRWANETDGRKSSLNLLPNLVLATPFPEEGVDKGKKVCILTAQELGLTIMEKNLARVAKNQLGDKKSIINFETFLDKERVMIHGLDQMSPKFNQSLNLNPMKWSQNWADRREIMNDIANKTKQLVKDHPEIQCFLIECTEAFGFAEQIKFATGLPVYTGNTLCNTGAQLMSLGYRTELPANTKVDPSGYDPDAARRRIAQVYGKISQGPVRIVVRRPVEGSSGSKTLVLHVDESVETFEQQGKSALSLQELGKEDNDEDMVAQEWIFDHGKIKLKHRHNFVLTLDQKESASVDNLENATVTLKKDAHLQTQLWFKEDGKIRCARNPDFVLDYSPSREKGASIILSKDKQDQSQRWSIYF